MASSGGHRRDELTRVKKIQTSQAWWPGPVITTLERERQENYELRASLCYIDPVSENTKSRPLKCMKLLLDLFTI